MYAKDTNRHIDNMPEKVCGIGKEMGSLKKHGKWNVCIFLNIITKWWMPLIWSIDWKWTKKESMSMKKCQVHINFANLKSKRKKNEDETKYQRTVKK